MGKLLAIPLGAMLNLNPTMLDGKPVEISLSLTTNGEWLTDPQNQLMPWSPSTECDLIEVLSRLTHIRILGDFTSGVESVGIDSFKISNTQGTLSSPNIFCVQIKLLA